jgi:hypothetical protein
MLHTGSIDPATWHAPLDDWLEMNIVIAESSTYLGPGRILSRSMLADYPPHVACGRPPYTSDQSPVKGFFG